MAAPANKPSVLLSSSFSSSSSSSPSTASRQNPRPRNSEAGDPIRRSFGGNPFPNNKLTVIANPRGFHNPSPTPANSPSDFPRRNSIGRESSQREFEDKENEKDQISNRSRAPPTPKGSKNFMSPTISAASKVNPSPKKKILAEKNDVNRSSLSFSDIRSLIMEEDDKKQPAKPCVSFSDVISIIEDNDKDERRQLEESNDMTVTDLDHKEALELESNVVTEPTEAVVNELKNSLSFDPSFKISPRSYVAYTSPSMVAPLDADPLMPPYDPKKNYLSPRPQFLHYRPNPRIEHYSNEGKQLDEIFISESSSDTEVSEMETRSQTSEKQLEENASREPESAAEEKTVVEEEEDDDEEEKGMEEQSSEQMVSKNIEAYGVSKPRCFKPFKFLGWLLFLAVAYFAVSATFSPSRELSMIRDSGFYGYHVPPGFMEFSRANCKELGEKLRMWSESSLAYLKMLLSSLGEEEELGQQRFYNLTDLMEDESFDAPSQPARAEFIMAKPNHQGYKSIKRLNEEENDRQEFDEPVKQKFGGHKNFEAFSGEDAEPETLETEGKIGGKRKAEVVSEKDVDEETQEFQEEIETKMQKLDEENLERFESADAYIGLQDNEVPGGENDFRAVFEEDGDQGTTHDVEQEESGEEKDFGEFSKDETREFQQAIEGETIKHDEEKPERFEPFSIYKDQQNAEARNESADNFKYEREHDDYHELENQEEKSDFFPEETSMATSKLDKDIEESKHKVSDEVSQVSAGKLLTNQNALALSLAVLALLAVSAVFSYKKAKLILPNAAASASEQTPPVSNYPSMSVDNLIKERLSSLNFQSEVDDRTGESCHSDLSSSFQKSRERKSSRKNSNYRRESLASSASEYSIGSASFGSFTTYEKIPIRSSNHGDEEVITPVRRSSRLRKQVSVQ